MNALRVTGPVGQPGWLTSSSGQVPNLQQGRLRSLCTSRSAATMSKSRALPSHPRGRGRRKRATQRRHSTAVDVRQHQDDIGGSGQVIVNLLAGVPGLPRFFYRACSSANSIWTLFCFSPGTLVLGHLRDRLGWPLRPPSGLQGKRQNAQSWSTGSSTRKAPETRYRGADRGMLPGSRPQFISGRLRPLVAR